MIDTKALRQKILDMAIRGQLVPQDENDEPASVLLEKIRAEKQRLIKEGKVKKDKNESVIFKGDDNRYYEKVGNNEPKCIDDEIPFDIPTSWSWVRLKTIGDWGAGATPPRGNLEYYGGPIAWVKTGELNNDFIYSSEETITEKALQECSLRFNHVGDVLIAMYGATIGKLGIAAVNLTTNQACCACTPHNGIYNLYLFYFLQSAKERLIKLGMGGAQPNISKDKIVNYTMPLPPLTEQERIVHRIEGLLAQVDIIDKNQNDIEVLYEDLKKRTLDLAIQGKLVPQDENDEPASVLLEKIRAEKKAQLGKKYVDSYIYKGDDNCYYEHIDGRYNDETVELPFNLPNNWCWARIQNISESYIGLTYDPSNIISSGGNIVLRSSNIKDGKLDLTDIVRVNTDVPEKLVIKKNDIIICARNGSKKLVGKSAIVDIERQNLTFGAFMAICRTQLFPYVYVFLQSELFFSQLAQVSGTTTINQLTQGNFNRFLIPIPPFNEQKRIVDRINEIFARI